MKRKLRKQLNKEIKSIRWDKLDDLPNYKGSGEYMALHWLKAYVEGRAAAEPRQLLYSTLRAVISKCDDCIRTKGCSYENTKEVIKDMNYALTLLRWVE